MGTRRGNGEGSIAYRKDKDIWEGRITLETGKRKSVYGKNRTEVVAKIKELTKTDAPDPTKARVGEWLEEWLTVYMRPIIRQATADLYAQQIRVHLEPELGGIKLKDLTPDRVQRFVNAKAESLSHETVRSIKAVLAQACKKAVELKMIGSNPCDHVRCPRGRSKPIKPYGLAEVSKLLDTMREHPLYAALLLEIMTGLRRGELLGLSWEDIDLKRGIISVRRALTVSSVGVALGEPKTRSGKRSIPIPSQVVEALLTHKAKQDAQRIRYGLTWEGSLVFCEEGGRYIHPKNFYQIFKRLIRRTGLPEVSFHDLRHTHATMLLAIGTNPKVAQERLGHASVSVTLDTYSHITPTMQDDLTDKLGIVLGKIGV